MSTRPRLTPAMADTRRAVRELLRQQFPDALSALTRMPGCVGGTGYMVPADAPLVLVGLSGGADSLALAAATAFEAQRCGLRAGAVVIDHGLQSGSAEVAARAAAQATALGLAPVQVIALNLVPKPVEGVEINENHGPEANARIARYAAFERALSDTGASAILLAHTLNDQAETVLLGLTRGAGTTSIAGMKPATGLDELDQLNQLDKLNQLLYLRPFLGITRAQTEKACVDQGLDPWHDPHNVDRAYTRVRIRHDVLPVLEQELGPGVAEALARTAAHLQEDAEVLDALAEKASISTGSISSGSINEGVISTSSITCSAISEQPRAIRTRVYRIAAAHAGVGPLTSAHLDAIDLLITNWHGQGALDVPGGTVLRTDGILDFRAE